MNSLRIFIAFTLTALFFNSAVAQNLFVAELGSSNIYEFKPDGSRRLFATNLPNAHGLVFNRDLFVAVLGGGRIYKLTQQGNQSIFASNLAPFGLAFDGASNLFTANKDLPRASSGTIEKFTPDGTRSTFASLSSPPNGLVFNSTGNLFVTAGNGNIYEFTPTGSQNVFASGISNPGFPAFDGAGNFFVPSADGNIYRFASNGTRSTFASGLDFPYGLAFDDAGNLFATDFNSGHIYKFTPDGNRNIFASGLSSPTGIAFAPKPSLHIVPAENHVVIFWPASATNYVLQSTTDLSATNWTTVTNGKPITGVVLPKTSPAFFRLQEK